jgi:hypothetical protein
LENDQMIVRGNSSAERQSTISLKATVMTALIVAFGILHIVGAVLLHDAGQPRPVNTSEVMMNRD